MFHQSKQTTLFLTLALAALLAACSPERAPISPAAEATIVFLQDENARLTDEITRLQAGADAADDEADLLGAMLAQQPTDDDSAESPLTLAAAEESAPTVAAPTPLPPPTPLPTFVAQTFEEEPPSDRFTASIPFTGAWTADPARQQTLGWALETQPSSATVVAQPFEHGVMLWRSDTGQIFALWTQDGRQNWRAFEDTFAEGEPEIDPALTAPGGLQQPARGFGKIWRQNPELREALGWAQVRENKSEALIQTFEHGLMAYVGARIYGIGQTPEGEPVWFAE